MALILVLVVGWPPSSKHQGLLADAAAAAAATITMTVPLHKTNIVVVALLNTNMVVVALLLL
jgi:hypothetical protein